MQASNNNKSTSIISWIGFGLATAVFILIWFVNIIVFQLRGEGANPIGGLYMLLIPIGGILGFMALIFSIVGLIMAIKNNTPRWIGTTGIIVCVLSILSFFVPIVCAVIKKNKALNVENTEPLSVVDEVSTEDVTIQIFSIGKVRCINNKNSSNTVVGNMSTFDLDFEKQLSSWLKMNNVDDSTTTILVNSTNDADYSDIKKVIDTLNKCKISKIKLSSNLKNSDYYR